MVNYCANPTCHKPLHYLRDGKIFLFSRKTTPDDKSPLPYRLEHFWLCGMCAKEWTMTKEGKDGKDEIKLVETGRRPFRLSHPTIHAQAS